MLHMEVAVPPEKPRSLRLKKPCFDKWMDYDLKFNTDTKVHERKQPTVIRDEGHGHLVELGKKRCQKVVSLSDFNQNTSRINGNLEKPLTLNDDLIIPKQPRCNFQRKKLGNSTGNLVNNNNKRKLKEVTSFDKGKTIELIIKDLKNGRNLRPKNQYEVTFVKRRRRFYEVFSGDIDPYWVVKQRIQIFWPLDEKWYFGVVKAYNLKSKRHHIKYDDHDEEWVDLQGERFKLLLHPTEIKNSISTENPESKIYIEDSITGSRVFYKSTKAADRLSQTMVSKKKDVSFVYVRRRPNKGRVDNLPKLVWHVSFDKSLLSWLLRLPLFSAHGILVPVLRAVRLEMAVIDNCIGLRIFSFEGHLKGAVDILCFAISRFCQKKVFRRNTKELERKQPCTSIGIKISGLYAQTTELYLLTYRFHEFGVLEWGLIESRMKKRDCFRVKKLSIANCTYANLHKVSSGNDLLFPSLCNGFSESLYKDIGHQSMFNHKMDSPVVLLYHQTSWSLHPSLFLKTHLKLLADKNTSASSVSSSLAWDAKTPLSSVSPTSVLSMNDFTPRSKKRRTVVSYSPPVIYDNPYSCNKPHIRKRQSWEHSNTFEIQQIIHARVVPVKTIPIPGAHLVDEADELCSEMQYVRDSTKYHREVRTEVERALEPANVLYDMDSSDEEWIENYDCYALNEDTLEQMLDSFEKLAYIKNSDELTAAELEEIASKYEHRDFINDAYEYWRHKRQKTGLPLIRQFQPPLWEVYQNQLHDWELSRSRLRTSSLHDFSNKACLEQKEKPASFAFCLKPRGLEVLNNSAEARPHKKFFTGRHPCCSSPRELDAVLYAFGKKSREPFSPRVHSLSHISSPRNITRTSINTELVNASQHGIIQSPTGCAVEFNMSDFRLYDASAAAAHAAKIAKLKREKAQLLFQKADLALYKAACAHVIADAVEKSGNDVTSKS